MFGQPQRARRPGAAGHEDAARGGRRGDFERRGPGLLEPPKRDALDRWRGRLRCNRVGPCPVTEARGRGAWPRRRAALDGDCRLGDVAAASDRDEPTRFSRRATRRQVADATALYGTASVAAPVEVPAAPPVCDQALDWTNLVFAKQSVVATSEELTKERRRVEPVRALRRRGPRRDAGPLRRHRPHERVICDKTVIGGDGRGLLESGGLRSGRADPLGRGIDRTAAPIARAQPRGGSSRRTPTQRTTNVPARTTTARRRSRAADPVADIVFMAIYSSSAESSSQAAASSPSL